MTTPSLPRPWATGINYSTGPDTGTPTKVDPSSDLNGFIRGVIAAPQHVNYLLGLLTNIVRRPFELAALRLRQLSQDGVTVTDTLEFMAAVQRNIGTPPVLAKAGESWTTGDWSRLDVADTLPSIDTQIYNAATDGSRIVAAGDNGTNIRLDYTDDDGATWTAGFAGGAAVKPSGGIYWNEFHSTFVFIASTNSAAQSPDGVTVPTSSGANDVEATSRIAILSNGDIVGLSQTVASPLTFRDSTDAGITWSNTAGTVANAAAADNRGCMAGNNGALVYHAASLTSGASIQISSSADGAAWSTLASIAPPGSSAFSGQCRLLMCQNTGLLVLASVTSSAQMALYASLDGQTWVGPHVLFPSPGINAFAVAGGRLFGTMNDMLFGSDGLGY